MDLICPVCGEPWDMDELHQVPGLPFGRAFARFRDHGCEVFDTAHGEPPNDGATLASQALMDELGDDVDAIVSMTDNL